MQLNSADESHAGRRSRGHAALNPAYRDEWTIEDTYMYVPTPALHSPEQHRELNGGRLRSPVHRLAHVLPTCDETVRNGAT